MFGQQWEVAQGTCLGIENELDGQGREKFLMEVRPQEGSPFRVMVGRPILNQQFVGPSVGDVVKMECDRAHTKARFDKADPSMDWTAQKKEHQAALEAQLSGGSMASGEPPDGRTLAPAQAARAADPSERLATLTSLHDQGVLTDAEYAARRQQIIDGI